MTAKPGTPSFSQREFWNGEAGARWTRYQEDLDRTLAPFGHATQNRAAPAPGERVVDIGCGCGATTLDLARAVGPSGAVVGIDVSVAMLERARERTGSLGNVRFAEADAATEEIPGAPFDLAYSRFGVMFFAEPVSAFRNLHRALRPGGRLAFACWRALAENPYLALPFEAVRDLLPAAKPAPPRTPGPFAFAERDYVEGIVIASGFTKIAIEAFETNVPLGSMDSNESVKQTVQFGPIARPYAELDATAQERVRERVASVLAQHAGPDGVVSLASAAWIVSAVKSGG